MAVINDPKMVSSALDPKLHWVFDYVGVRFRTEVFIAANYCSGQLLEDFTVK